jgi:cytochrome c1
MNIYSQWKNTIQSFCEKDEASEKFCIWLRAIVQRNHANIVHLAKEKHEKSQYQHQIWLFYQQLFGIELGFKKGTRRARKDFEIPSEDFLLLNARVDIEDLKIYYNKYVEEDEENFIEVRESVGSMILKLFNDNETSKVVIGHSSESDYNAMLKIVKTYRFNYHQGPGASNHLVANTDITFTAYPGSIASTDDFYIAHGKHSRIIVAGVKMKYKQAVQLHGVDLDGTVLLSVRVMAATRLARNGKAWSHFMSRDPDIGAKQWIVVDEKRLKYLEINDQDDGEFITSSSTAAHGLVFDNEVPSETLDNDKEIPLSLQVDKGNNIIWLVDNTWKRLHAEDVTSRFKKDGVWLFGKLSLFICFIK